MAKCDSVNVRDCCDMLLCSSIDVVGQVAIVRNVSSTLFMLFSPERTFDLKTSFPRLLAHCLANYDMFNNFDESHKSISFKKLF